MFRGLLRRSDERHADDLRLRRWQRRAVALPTVVQRLAAVHDQLSRPSCVGQAHASGLEGVTGHRVSAVSLWEGARILQGDAGVDGVGTRGEYALEWMGRHGWSDYVPGEDARPAPLDVDSRPDDSLAAMMRAHE